MQRMAEPVTGIVAEKLGTTLHEASELLRDLARSVQGQVEAEGQATVHGLGIFSRSDSGLTFTPDETLLDSAWLSLDALQPVGVVEADTTESVAPEPPPARRWRWLSAAAVLVLLTALAVWQLWPLRGGEDTVAFQGTAATDSATATPPLVPDAEKADAAPAGGLDHTAGGFTVVVASLDDRSRADGEVARFRALTADLGVPVDVLASGDGTRYRIVVGQAPTIGELQELRTYLAARAPGAWVLRIGSSL